MKKWLWTAAIAAFTVFSAQAADLPSRKPPPAADPSPERAIWGAIAYAPEQQAEGIYWGGATEGEAREAAEKHCAGRLPQGAGASLCQTRTVFYNGWRNSTPAQPWPHCGALATAAGRWGAAQGDDQQGANAEALAKCGDRACVVVRAACT